MKKLKWNDVKAYLFFTLITIAMLMCSSCGKDDPEQLLRPGFLQAYIDAEVDGLRKDYTGKSIPSCSEMQPVYAVYSLQNEYIISSTSSHFLLLQAGADCLK